MRGVRRPPGRRQDRRRSPRASVQIGANHRRAAIAGKGIGHAAGEPTGGFEAIDAGEVADRIDTPAEFADGK
jgi:hypothetical protein